MNETKTYVQVRIDHTIKEDAALVLKSMDLSIADFIRIALARVARDKAIPFDVRVPNAKTRAAMIEARQNIADKKARFTSPEELFNELENKAN